MVNRICATLKYQILYMCFFHYPNDESERVGQLRRIEQKFQARRFYIVIFYDVRNCRQCKLFKK